MKELKIFERPDFGQIRVNQNECGEPLFCLADVCKALNLSNSRKVKERLNPKGVISSYTPTNGGVQELLFINEQNLYKAIFQSRKKEAEKFVDWVTGEVLPSIRKTGAYHVEWNAKKEDKLSDRIELAKFVMDQFRHNDVNKLKVVKWVAVSVATFYCYI